MKLSKIKKCTLVFACATFLSGCSTQEIPLDGAMSDAVTKAEVTTLGESVTSTQTDIETTTPTATTTDTTTIATTVEDTSQEVSNTETDTDTTDTTTTVESFETTTATETTTNDETLFGYTVEEVTSIAKDLYQKACEKYRSVLIDGAYSIDFESAVTDQYGKRYYRVNDPYYSTTESVFEDWHSVFTDSYDELINTTYVMYDGNMYAYVAIQQENTNYDSTTLTYYYPSGDSELTFKATSHYSSGDKVFEFCIAYNQDTKEWRVSKFTMPY